MTRIVRISVLLGVMVALGTAPGRGGDDPQEILEKVRAKYESIRDAELKFVQKTRFALSKLEQRSNGTLFLKKDHKYRIETEDHVVVTDGETVWSYSLPNKQVLIDKFKLTAGSLSPDRILAGAPEDFGAVVLGHEKLGKADVVVLKLIPRGEQALINALRLWIDTSDWLIRKAELTDVNNKETTYTVSDIKLNPGLPETRFTLTIPEGVEVVDLR